MKSVFLLLFVFIFSSIYLTAQSIQFQFVESSSTDFLVDSTYDAFSNLQLSTSISKELTCEVSDTSDIASITVKLGTESGSSDLMNQSFSFSGEVVSAFLSLSRTGIICHFALGQLVNRDFAYLQLEARSSSGALLGAYSHIHMWYLPLF